MRLIIRWLIISAAILLTAQFVPGITANPWWIVLIVGACLMFINTIIKPIITLLTLPITIITLGLFSLVINALIFWGLSDVVRGFAVEGFIPALVGSIIVSVLHWLGDRFFS